MILRLADELAGKGFSQPRPLVMSLRFVGLSPLALDEERAALLRIRAAMEGDRAAATAWAAEFLQERPAPKGGRR